MISSSSYQGRVTATLAVALIFVFAWAQGAEADSVPKCETLTDGIELDDGSVVAAGSDCLVKFRPDGTLERDFGTEGIVPVPSSSNQWGRDGLLRTPSGFIVVRPEVILAFTATGQTDMSFGDQGRLEPTDALSFAPIFDATADSAGNIYVAGYLTIAGSNGYAVVKLRPDGSLDATFGNAGVYQVDDGAGFRLTFLNVELDGQERLLLAGDASLYPSPRAGVIRLTTGGNLDESFGTAGYAESPPIPNPGSCAGGCQMRIEGIGFDAEGGIVLMGGVRFFELKTGFNATFWARFGGDGTPLAVSSGDIGNPAAAHALLPGGDLALASGVGERVHPDGKDAFPPGRTFDGGRLAEAGFYSASISFNPSTGNLLSVGMLSPRSPADEFGCLSFVCPSQKGAAVKIDALTGEPVPGFGVNGAVMSSPNDCPAGRLPSVDGHGPWSRCRLARPITRLGAELGHGRSARPSLKVSAKLTSPPLVPLFLEQELRIRLPEQLRLRKGWKRKLTIGRTAVQPGTFRTRVAGRTVVIRFAQTVVRYEPNPYEYDPPPPNGDISAVLRLGRGSIKPFVKKARGRKFSLLASGRFMPNTDESIPWWGTSKWSRSAARFRVPKRGR